METGDAAEEPTPLKAVSNSSVSINDVMSSSNGAAIGYDCSMQVLVNGHDGAANSASASSDLPLTSF